VPRFLRPPPLSFAYFQPPYDLSELYHLFRIAIPGKPSSLGCLVYSSIHDSIKANNTRFTSNQAPNASRVILLKAACSNSSAQKLLQRINKNAIIKKYTESCLQQGATSEVTTIKKGKLTKPPTTYPTIYELVRDCSMKPSIDHQYQVEDLNLDNVIVELLKSSESFLADEDIANLSKVNSLYQEMVDNIVEFRTLDVIKLGELRIGYAEQTEIQSSRVNMATACAILYSLHPGMVIRYAKGEYVGENRDATQILRDISSHVNKTDVAHIKCILTQGCPAKISFGETLAMKALIIKKGNQAMFKMYPETVTKTMNKEDRHSHLLPIKLWVLHFSPWCRHMAQGMQVKPGKKPRVIFDASTKGDTHEVVLNKITTTKFEANITFGLAKLKLLQGIYNWRISHPDSKIYLVLADITACFRFPQIHTDVTGAFGFMAEGLYFLTTSMVFGSNTSASSWEPF
jgi:hypothetical protein